MITIAMLGQSVMSNMWLLSSSPPTPNPNTYMWNGAAWVAPTGNGLITFANKVQSVSGQDVRILPYAVGGSGLTGDANDGTHGWWLDPSAGGIYGQFITALALSGGACDMVLWDQGQNDSQMVGYTEYISALATLKTRIDAQLGVSVPFVAAVTGNYKANGINIGDIRQAQLTWGGSIAGPAYYDLPTEPSGVHPTAISNQSLGLRWARSALNVMGLDTHTAQGPKIANASRSGLNVTVNVTLNGGTGLWPGNPATSLSGFEISDDGFYTTIPITSAAIIAPNTTQILLALGTTPRGICQLRYLWGQYADASNCVFSNTNPYGDIYGLPMIPTKATIQIT